MTEFEKTSSRNINKKAALQTLAFMFPIICIGALVANRHSPKGQEVSAKSSQPSEQAPSSGGSTIPQDTPAASPPPPENSPSVDFRNGIAIGIPQTPSSDTQGAWIVDFNGAGDLAIACVGQMEVSDGIMKTFSASGCSPSLEAGKPVRFHFIANDQTRHMYSIPDELQTSSPANVNIWQASRSLYDSTDTPLGKGWSEITGTATSITFENTGMPGYRFENIATHELVDLICGGMVIVDPTNTRFETTGLRTSGSGCVPLDKMGLVTLATPNKKIYFFGVKNMNDAIRHSKYEWVAP